PPSVMGGNFLAGEWPDVATALEVSAFSLKSLAVATRPLLTTGAGIVGLTFDASFAWPVYDWMGVAKAAFESTARYLARDLGPEGIRVNLVSAGPIRTTAATSIPGFDQMEDTWDERAPLGWDVKDAEPAARAVVALCSDWFPATTAEIVHVDGGGHATGQGWADASRSSCGTPRPSRRTAWATPTAHSPARAGARPPTSDRCSPARWAPPTSHWSPARCGPPRRTSSSPPVCREPRSRTCAPICTPRVPAACSRCSPRCRTPPGGCSSSGTSRRCPPSATCSTPSAARWRRPSPSG